MSTRDRRRPHFLAASMVLLLGAVGGTNCGDRGWHGITHSTGGGGVGGMLACTPGGEPCTDHCCLQACIDGHCAYTYGEGSSVPSFVDSSTSSGFCLDETGSYEVTATGSGCRDLDAMATQCVKTDTRTCTDEFTSHFNGAAGQAITGSAELDMQGAFSTSPLTVGTAVLDCEGTWEPTTGTLTVSCGATEDCVITLKRSSPDCPP